MKDFRKTPEGLYICEECQRICINANSLSLHIKYRHNGQKEYYDKWLKEEGEGICKICGKETIFIQIKHGGYKKCCSQECANKSKGQNYTKETFLKRKETLIKHFGVDNPAKIPGFKEKLNNALSLKTPEEREQSNKKRKQTNRKKYGVEYFFQTNIFKEKSRCTKKEHHGDENYVNVKKGKQTKKERYGNENYTNIEKAQETCLERYGCKGFNHKKGRQTKKEKYDDENYNNREQYKETCKEKFGVENPSQSKEIKKKKEQTMLKHFGVEYVFQDPKLLHKCFKTSVQIKPYKDAGLWYQGSNEFDFLEKYYERFKDDLDRGPTIKYFFNNNNRIYFSDFIIKTLNLVIECKSSYFMRRDKEEIEAKKNATLEAGYDYIIIVDKDYTEFDKLLHEGI